MDNNLIFDITQNVTNSLSSMFSMTVIAYTLFVMWRVFTKANVPGWKALIPGYNVWTLCEIVWGRGSKMFFFFIPIYGIVVWFKTCTRLAKAFGKSLGFGVGLFFIDVVFLSLLAFTDVTYYGPQDIA